MANWTSNSEWFNAIRSKKIWRTTVLANDWMKRSERVCMFVCEKQCRWLEYINIHLKVKISLEFNEFKFIEFITMLTTNIDTDDNACYTGHYYLSGYGFCDPWSMGEHGDQTCWLFVCPTQKSAQFDPTSGALGVDVMCLCRDFTHTHTHVSQTMCK